jgi:hypothetical protein
MIIQSWGLRSDGNLFGHSPHKPNQLTGNGHDHLVGVFPAGDQVSVTFTAPTLGLPADVLDGFGWLFQSELELPAEFSRIAIRPSAFHQGATGMGGAGVGDRTLSAALASGVFRGNQPQKFHEFPGVIEAREVAEFGHHGDRHGALDAAQGLESVDHRAQTPRFDLLVEFPFETLEAFGVFGNGTDIFLKDDVLSRCRTDHLGEPSEMGRVPGGPAGGSDIVSPQEGFETELGILKSTAGIFARPSEIANGFVFNRGDIDGGEIPRACQPGQLHGVSAVRVDAVTSLLGNQRRRHHPAVVVFFRQIAVEPVATRAGFIDKDEVFGLGLHLPDELVEVTLAGADGAQIGHLSAVILSHIGHRNGLLMDISSDVTRARLGHG